MPDTAWLPLTPLTRARPKRTGLVRVTPGTCSTRRRTAGGNGEKPSVFCTTNAAFKLSSTALAIVVFTPAAKIDTNATSATPTISAAAVTAVRPGWRVGFSRARRADGVPPRQAAGDPPRALERPADDRRQRPDEVRADERHAEERRQRAAAD